MSTEKQQAIDLIERLPDDVSTETILVELRFKKLMLRRGEDAARGERLVSHLDAKHRIASWLNSSGT
jgi:hypothetical protein